jgi:hypothetical protein
VASCILAEALPDKVQRATDKPDCLYMAVNTFVIVVLPQPL